jgi:hypothetical protein
MTHEVDRGGGGAHLVHIGVFDTTQRWLGWRCVCVGGGGGSFPLDKGKVET